MTEAHGADGSAPTSHVQGVHTPAFRRLWWSWTVSLLGDGVRGLALPLYVAIETKSPLWASAVVAAEVLPWLLFALPAGAIVDRARPKIVVTVAHAFRAVLTAALVVCIVTGNAPVVILCVFAFVLTIAETFAYTASQSLMVSLAGPDKLREANSKFYTVHTIGLNLAGPLAAGALFLLGPAWAFALDGVTFVIAAILIVGIPTAVGKPATSEKQPTRRLRSEVKEGLSLLFGIPGLRILVLMVAAATVAGGAMNALTPLYAVQTLSMPAALVSTLLVAAALGTLLGTRLVVPATRRWSDGQIMVISVVVMATGMIVFGAFPFAPSALAANALIGVGVGAFNVLAAARRQRLTPGNAMGRISGAYRMVAWGLMPIGAGLAGPLAVITSLGAVFVIVGALILAVLAVLARGLLRTDAEVPVPRDGSAGNSAHNSPKPTRSPSTSRPASPSTSPSTSPPATG